jgi:GR25 family glycosyltransferase involved in LPS biosynthesis
MDAFNNANKFPFQIERFPAKVMQTGEDGCTYSHLAVLEANKDNVPFIVFEDDCIMLEPWETVCRCVCEIRPKWDALWLGATLTEKLQRETPHTFRLRKAYCLHAVVYNSTHMINYILQNHNTPAGKNLDIFYYFNVFNKYHCYLTNPLCATQSEGYSDIAKKKTDSWIIRKNYDKYTK